MNATERLQAMVAGKPVDRPGATLWKHFFLEDRNITDLVKRTAGFQDQNDWDLIKVMANGIHLQEQYNSEIIWSKDSNMFPITVRRHCGSPKAFTRLKPVDVKSGAIAREVEVCKRLVDIYKGKVPVLATVFTPLTYAQELYNGWNNPWPMADLIKDYPDELEEGIKVLTEVTCAMTEEYIKAGVDGIFLASQLANDKYCSAEDYKRLGIPYDKQVIDVFAGKTWFNMFHIHGTGNLFFDLVKDYKVESFSWEDILSTTSIKQLTEECDKIPVAGIEMTHDFDENDRDKLRDHLIKRIKEADAQVKDHRLIIACGCALPTDIPEYKYNVLKEAMEAVYGVDKK